MQKRLTGSEIRQSFINYFINKRHTYVPSSSLVPGGDQTLLFTNAGMVQFKDVFLGTDHRPYTRAVNSQKCMRVAGKHNDLDDVGRDDTHHTFFEMLGNWSFGDYYKKEAINWAWELLTEVWKLEKNKLWVTYFKDEFEEIPEDEEAAGNWRKQDGIDPGHILSFGRKDNFWEMADTGPCGPCSEVHYDQGLDFCDKQDIPGHVCRVNGDCKRFLELWNLVFIQYNRFGPSELEPLPACHVDTGMGFERIVAVLQGVYSNYKTDLFSPLIDKIQQLTAHTLRQRDADLTPYRVIADHSRSAAFLIADGVVPGNTGRNYVCRMVIRRASRFGTKMGLDKPFLAQVAETVIENYQEAYPELKRNRAVILDNLTREEERFRRTVEAGLNNLNDRLEDLKSRNLKVLDGKSAFDLYATHGLPLEIARDIAREQDMEVDDVGFHQAMEEHRIISGAGKVFGPLGGEDVDIYRAIFNKLSEASELGDQGVKYDPYNAQEFEGKVLALIKNGVLESEVKRGDKVEVILPRTNFYVEAGGQVSDTGTIVSVSEPRWEIKVDDTRKPAAGVIVHIGEVISGQPKVNDKVTATVDAQRRIDIIRNHTATHLLHAELHTVLGDHAHQAGSLVAPDRLRFDFTHPRAVTPEQLEQLEMGVNRVILENHILNIAVKPISQAIEEGAIALFGEKYGETVRTVSIGDVELFSYELCGGTHVKETGDIGIFLIISESSAAAGVRRIEAVTGREAYNMVLQRTRALNRIAGLLESTTTEAPVKTRTMLDELERLRKQMGLMRQKLVALEFNRYLEDVPLVDGIPMLSVVLPDADSESLRKMADKYRQAYSSGVVVLGSVFEGRPIIIAAVTKDLVKRGLNAKDLVKSIAQIIDGSGGGRPTLAQAGGKKADKLQESIKQALPFICSKLSKM